MRPAQGSRGYAMWLQLAAITWLATCAGCGGGSSSMPRPVLGSSEKSITAAWGSADHVVDCGQENLETVCRYLYRGVHIAVAFDQHLLAERFQTDGKPHPSVNMWQLLNSMIPGNARRISCRSVAHSSGGGMARACLYRSKVDMIVAYFPHPSETDFGGVVSFDFEEYKDIQG